MKALVAYDTENDVWVISVHGRIDSAAGTEYEKALNLALENNQGPRVVVVLHNVDYVSSMGLRATVTAKKVAMEQGGDVVLCGLSPRTHDVFEMTGLTGVFEVYDTLDEAVKAIVLKSKRSRAEE